MQTPVNCPKGTWILVHVGEAPKKVWCHNCGVYHPIEEER